MYSACTHFPPGKSTAQNGFMSYGTLEEDHVDGDGDVYPDGPLQSGTQSLRRISANKKVLLLKYGELVVAILFGWY